MLFSRRQVGFLWGLVSWTLFLYYSAIAVNDFLERKTITDVDLLPTKPPSISICVTIKELYMFANLTKSQSEFDNFSEQKPSKLLKLISVLRVMFPIVFMNGTRYPFLFDYFKRASLICSILPNTSYNVFIPTALTNESVLAKSQVHIATMFSPQGFLPYDAESNPTVSVESLKYNEFSVMTISMRRLPYPYETNCRHYYSRGLTGQRNCFENCNVGRFVSSFIIRPEHNAVDRSPNLNINTSCVAQCRFLSCYEEFYSATSVRKMNNRGRPWSLTIKRDPITISLALVPLTSIGDFVFYLVGLFNLCLGIAFIHTASMLERLPGYFQISNISCRRLVSGLSAFLKLLGAFACCCHVVFVCMPYLSYPMVNSFTISNA